VIESSGGRGDIVGGHDQFTIDQDAFIKVKGVLRAVCQVSLSGSHTDSTRRRGFGGDHQRYTSGSESELRPSIPLGWVGNLSRLRVNTLDSMLHSLKIRLVRNLALSGFLSLFCTLKKKYVPKQELMLIVSAEQISGTLYRKLLSIGPGKLGQGKSCKI
jgi:hypothetical protein